MKHYLSVLILGFLVISCVSDEERIKEARKEVLSTDRAFSAMSANQGTNAAFLHYAATDAIKLQDGTYPVIGIMALRDAFMAAPDSGFKLTWEPIKAEVSQSGDLAYTFGNYELLDFTRNQIRYGNYVTIWRKMDDGSWKWVLDGGASTPPPR